MSRSFFRTYGFLGAMLLSIVLGCVLGALWPGAACLAPLGTIFINLMFCIVVPLVFCSLAGSIACMKSPRRAGKIMGTTLLVFIVTGLIAAAIMLLAVRLYPPVSAPWTDAAAGTVDAQASIAELLVNFFTVEDFAALLSRRAMLPLIVFSILAGFAVNLSGGKRACQRGSSQGRAEQGAAARAAAGHALAPEHCLQPSEVAGGKTHGAIGRRRGGAVFAHRQRGFSHHRAGEPPQNGR